MEIRKIELNLGQKVANPFKTTRKSSTNPFYSINFEGNTIDPLICADVLDSFKGKENKLKMITSSVMGSMTRLKNSITEPITHFVNRVKEGWNVAVEKIGLKDFAENIHTTGEKINEILSYDIGKGITDSLATIKKGITDTLSYDITGLGKDLSTKWTAIVGKIHQDKIPSGLSVAEYRSLWIKENELIANSVKEAA